MADQPLDHVLRFEPPWRADLARKTECGRSAADVASVVAQEALLAKVAELGKQRAAFTSCMVCWDRTKYAQPWDVSPASVLDRESSYTYRQRTDERLDREMRALTLLWEAHRDEFDQAMSDLGEVKGIAAKRAQRQKQNARSFR